MLLTTQSTRNIVDGQHRIRQYPSLSRAGTITVNQREYRVLYWTGPGTLQAFEGGIHHPVETAGNRV